MLRKILTGSMIIILLNGLEVQAQKENLDSLNYFKYVVVKTLFYDDNMVVDKYSISGNVRKHFLEKGFIVVTETKRYWPKELFENPCMALYCDIQHSAGMFTKYKVLIKLTDCNGKLIYSTLGKGTGDTETEAYKDATDRALYHFDKWDYHYMPGKTIQSEERHTEAEIAGMFESMGEQSSIKIEISPVNDHAEARVIQSQNKAFKKDQLLATFRSSTLGENLYIVKWMPESKTSYETVASYDKGAGSITVELKENGQTKKIVFRKME